MVNLIEIFGNFDGGNPKDPGSIIQTGPNAFTIIPFSEDNDPNYKFRLDVKAVNRSAELRKINLTIDWQEPRFNHLRNYIYLKHTEETDWTYLPLTPGDTKVTGEIIVKSGESYLALHPKYNYGDYLQFVGSIPESGFIKKEIFGLSPEGRELWVIKVNPGGNGKRPIIFVARVHPYETSGSYCVEGIANYFTENLSPLAFDLSPIYLIPMANPDGVYNGLCKKTALNGIDLSKENDDSNGLWLAIAELTDSIEPAVYCELHNWMFPDWDGIYFLNWMQARRFIRRMPPQKEFRKTWKPMLDRKLFAINHQGLKQYCKNKFGSLSLCLEYPWRNRRISDTKLLGIHTMKAMASM